MDEFERAYSAMVIIERSQGPVLNITSSSSIQSKNSPNVLDLHRTIVKEVRESKKVSDLLLILSHTLEFYKAMSCIMFSHVPLWLMLKNPWVAKMELGGKLEPD